MLTLYIMRTHYEKKNIADLYYALSGLWFEGTIVNSVDEINADNNRDADWYIILFDNEIISLDLRGAIQAIMKIDPKIDVFIFMEKNGDRYTQSPRLFRKHVQLQKNSFLPIPEGGYKYERILDGWLKKDVF